MLILYPMRQCPWPFPLPYNYLSFTLIPPAAKFLEPVVDHVDCQGLFADQPIPHDEPLAIGRYIVLRIVGRERPFFKQRRWRSRRKARMSRDTRRHELGSLDVEELLAVPPPARRGPAVCRNT